MSQNKPQPNKKISLEEMNEAVMRSGYLLEQRVEDVLKIFNYSVQANPIYPDPDTGKSREYDIDATKAFEVFGKHKRLNGIYLKILCECKHNPQPIIFFNKELEQPYIASLDIKASGIPLQFPDKDIIIMGLSDFDGMERYHHYCSGLIATQWCTFQLKNKENI